MDEQDRRILEILQRDAAITNADLAARVHMSPSSCLRRVKRLEESGVITGQVALVDADKVGRGLTAVVSVILDRHGRSKSREFVRLVMEEAAVTQAYSVTGEADVMLVMRLRDMKEFHRLSERLFEHDPNVLRFHTHFVLDCYKYETAVPVDVTDW